MVELWQCFIANTLRYTKNGVDECEQKIFFDELKIEIKETLTAKEYLIYQNCLIQEKKLYQYAQELGVSPQYISKSVSKIRKKIKRLI